MHQDELNELKHRFAYHPPSSDEVVDAHTKARALAYEFAKAAYDLTPSHSGRERALFLTKVEEALFWLNAGIARGNAPRQSSEVKTR